MKFTSFLAAGLIASLSLINIPSVKAQEATVLRNTQTETCKIGLGDKKYTCNRTIISFRNSDDTIAYTFPDGNSDVQFFGKLLGFDSTKNIVTSTFNVLYYTTTQGKKGKVNIDGKCLFYDGYLSCEGDSEIGTISVYVEF